MYSRGWCDARVGRRQTASGRARLARGVAVAGHRLADGGDVDRWWRDAGGGRERRLVGDVAMREHQQARAEREQLVEVFADEQHGAAGVARVAQAAVDLGGGLEVEAE